MVSKRQRPPKLLGYGLLLAAFILLVNVAILLWAREGSTRAMLMTLGPLLWNTLTAVALFYAASRSRLHSRRAVLAWTALALGQVALTSGYLVTLGQELGWAVPESLVQLVFLVCTPLFLLGILALPAKPLSWSAWGKTGLDMAIVLLAATLVLWNYWLRPLLAAAGVANLAIQLLVLPVPVGHLVQLWALLILLYRQPKGQTPAPLYLWLLGTGLSLVSDFNLGYKSVIGTYSTADGLNLGWVAANLSFGLAGLWQAVSVQPPRAAAAREASAAAPSRLNPWLTYLPYGCALAAYLMLDQLDQRDAAAHILGAWSVRSIIGLVLVRQTLTLHENSRLFAQARQQAIVLQATNQELALEIEERTRAETQFGAANEALRQSEQRLRQVIDLVPHFIFAKDLEGRYVLANRACAEGNGTTVDKLLGKLDADITQSAAEVQRFRTDDCAVISSGQAKFIPAEPLTDAQGQTRILQTTKIPFTFSGTTIPAVLGVSIDITEQKRAEEALRLTEARQRALLSALPDLMFRISRDGTYLDCSDPRGDSIIPAEQLIGTNLREHGFLAEIVDESLAIYERALTTGEIQIQEYTVATKQGPRSYEARVVRSGPDEVVSIVRDVTERKQAEERLAHDAVHDALTGLPNRLLFMERLRHALEFAKRHAGYFCAVLFLDLDRFKVINDSLGHTIGDQLLIALAQRLRLCVPPSDTVARLGGDEFVILLEDTTDRGGATRPANRIQEQLKLPFSLDGHQVVASASIGIVADAHGYERPEDVLRDADLAMYQAKALGKAQFTLFSAAMRAQAMNRLGLENDLREALARRELALYYQPIVSLPTEQITGFEALLRWRHPQRGLVGPLEFISIAEETGLIIPIGQWVLAEACRQLKVWQTCFPRTPPLTMNVNISGVQFAAPDFVEQVTTVLQAVGLEPRTLHLEITEGVCLNNSALAIALFQQLRQLGVQFHLDDFGTGYSSLAYLHYFPIQTLKIDRSFVQRIGEQGNHTDLVRAVITLAHDLGMDAVAEGVETVEQLTQLKALGCNYGQGYLLSRPVDKIAIEKLLSGHGTACAPQPTQGESDAMPKKAGVLTLMALA